MGPGTPIRICCSMTAEPGRALHPRSTVRARLLALVLLPVVLALPATLALTVYWCHAFSDEQLRFKADTDLAVAMEQFARFEADQLAGLARVADSARLRAAVAADDRATMSALLARAGDGAGFGFLRLLDAGGATIAGPAGVPPSPLMEAALAGGGVGIEVLSLASLAAVDADPVRAVAVTPVTDAGALAAAPMDGVLLLRLAQPVRDADERVLGVLDAGLLLNHNAGVVDRIRDLLYGPHELGRGISGAVSLLLGAVRVSTNVSLAEGKRAIGSHAPPLVVAQVLGEGRPWVDRAPVLGRRCVCGYAPLTDVHGVRVGMLNVGFPEARLRHNLTLALETLVALFVGIGLLTAVVGVLGAHAISRPLEAMAAVMHATRAGEHRRVGPVRARDEVGLLARELDAMLDLLAERNAQVAAAAAELEGQVAERTAELQRRNAELTSNLRLLQETREALLGAERLAAVGELAAGVAHEINNPMAVILGHIDLLIADLGSAVEPVRGDIDMIIAQVYRVRAIIDSLLRYVRPADYAGWIETLDVNGLIDETLPLVSHALREAGLDIAWQPGATRPIAIARADLQQVLINLLMNAIQAQRGRPGAIRVETWDWDDLGVGIRIADCGAGIPPEVQARLFTPFVTTKAVGQGSGLGLAISRMLLDRYGADVTVTTAADEGTAFTLWLRAEPEPGGGGGPEH